MDSENLEMSLKQSPGGTAFFGISRRQLLADPSQLVEFTGNGGLVSSASRRSLV